MKTNKALVKTVFKHNWWSLMQRKVVQIFIPPSSQFILHSLLWVLWMLLLSYSSGLIGLPGAYWPVLDTLWRCMCRVKQRDGWRVGFTEKDGLGPFERRAHNAVRLRSALPGYCSNGFVWVVAELWIQWDVDHVTVARLAARQVLKPLFHFESGLWNVTQRQITTATMMEQLMHVSNSQVTPVKIENCFLYWW